MLLADDVFRRAIEVRDDRANHAAEFQNLSAVLKAWAQQAFWGRDHDTRVKVLAAALASNSDLRMELADKLSWVQPVDTSAELILLAVSAIQKGEDAAFGAIFSTDLNWLDWKKNHDLTVLQTLLENNTPVRQALARAVKGYPGASHLRDIATLASQRVPAAGAPAPVAPDAVLDVLHEHFLNWEAFQAGRPKLQPHGAPPDPQEQQAQEKVLRQAARQELQLQAALSDDYQFRQRVAEALKLPNSEASELASLAVEMWRAIPRSWSGRTRAKMLLKVNQRVREILHATANLEPHEQVWNGVKDRLAILFTSEPQQAVDLWRTMEWPQPFSLIFREELTQIEARRRLCAVGDEPLEPQAASAAPDVSDLAARKNLFGVAFSGGGIRSATFNLGVLQKLSDFGLLRKVDYLSTVSGGGYIGSWLSAWIRKNKNPDLAGFLADLSNLLSPKVRDPRADAQRPVQFLREFSNYLTPKLGSFSFDTWTMAAVYSRNLALNQATLICVLGFLLLIPRFLVYPLTLEGNDTWMWVAAIALVATGVYCMSVNIGSSVSPSSTATGGINSWARDHVQLSVIATFLVGMYFGSLWIWRNICFLEDNKESVVIGASIIAAFLSLLLSIKGGFIEEFRKRQMFREWGWLGLILTMITLLSAGAMTGLLLLDLAATYSLNQMNGIGVWHGEIWSPVMLLAVLVVPGTLQVGLMGVDFPDAGREWLSRFRAICTVYTIWWLAFLGAAMYGPYLILSFSCFVEGHYKVWLSGLTVGWIVTTIGGLAAGSSKKTGTDNEGNPKISWLQILARIAPPVFVVGLVLLIATFEQLLLAHGQNVSFSLKALIDAYWNVPDLPHLWTFGSYHVDHLWGLFVVLLAAGGVLAWRVDINEFSMHHFYKNRLVRCYMGASNEKRRPDGFTGFDALDDLRLAQLKAIPDPGETPYRGPYQILNTTLNLSMGEQLAWQERKGASFILSPCYCGFDVQGWTSSTAAKAKPSSALRRSEELLPAGYRKTSHYTRTGGPLLGTSFSISGAAANPNQGYNTSPAVAFLMTMFDVRLGWWLGNPRRDTAWKYASPTVGLLALISELLGMTNDKARFVNLSDGGHFENMGIYELVRRRCSLILLCDAEQDDDFKFVGLGSAIRKCRVDFGAHIEIDPSLIRPNANGGRSATHCAIGRIVYLDGSEGTLVYIKPSLTGDEPEDVTQYHMAHSQFPHETTADQWFAESQFESYRALGYHATDHTLTPATAWITWDRDRPDVPRLFEALKRSWYPVNPNLKENASRNTAALSRLLNQIRHTPELHALGAKLFPGITVPQPNNQGATQEFYFSLCIVQLVEDLFFDFQLDHKVWFDDPDIGGWRYLFQTWKRVPEVASAWAAVRNTFREDFQRFWDGL